jgi:hypothetical protein
MPYVALAVKVPAHQKGRALHGVGNDTVPNGQTLERSPSPSPTAGALALSPSSAGALSGLVVPTTLKQPPPPLPATPINPSEIKV